MYKLIAIISVATALTACSGKTPEQINLEAVLVCNALNLSTAEDMDACKIRIAEKLVSK